MQEIFTWQNKAHEYVFLKNHKILSMKANGLSTDTKTQFVSATINCHCEVFVFHHKARIITHHGAWQYFQVFKHKQKEELKEVRDTSTAV